MSESRLAALERLKAKRQNKASSASRSISPAPPMDVSPPQSPAQPVYSIDDNDHDLPPPSSPDSSRTPAAQSKVLVPASSPLDTSPASGAPSKFFNITKKTESDRTRPMSSGVGIGDGVRLGSSGMLNYRNAVFGDANFGSLNKHSSVPPNPAGGHGGSRVPPAISTHAASSLSDADRTANGQPLAKRQVARWENGSPAASYPASATASPGGSTSGNGTDVELSTSLKRRLPDDLDVGTSTSSEPPSASPSTASFPISTTTSISSSGSQLIPERVTKILPSITEDDVYAVMDNYPNEGKAEWMKRLFAKHNGITYRPSTTSNGPLRPPDSSPLAAESFYSSPPVKVEKKPEPKKVSAIYRNRSIAAEYANESPTKTSARRETAAEAEDTPAPKTKNKARVIVGSDESDFDMMSEDDDDDEVKESKVIEDVDEGKALQAWNTCKEADITGTIACSAEQAAAIISLRPFASVDELRKKLKKTKGVSPALFEQYIDVQQGYVEVDRCLNVCEDIGRTISQVMEVWTGSAPSRPTSKSGTATPNGTTANNDTGLHVATVDPEDLKRRLAEERDSTKKSILRKYIQQQPSNLKAGVKLKDYQMVGLNWLNLLFERRISCILADEMGLGKTIQVISFFALLKQKGVKGPHLIVVPSSTLENWVREFDKFTEDISVHTYYGSQDERMGLRRSFPQMAEDGELEVLLTTYDMAWKHDDQKFLRKKMSFTCCVYDEGHTLKNFTSQRYKSLIQIRPKWRLLLTGTPIQNNLQELVSLLNFIKEDVFMDAEDQLRQIFKVHAKGVVNLLSQQRVSRARTMMTPFVLRRKKAQVLKDLPPKIEMVRECELSDQQKRIYDEILNKSRAAMKKGEIDLDDIVEEKKPKRGTIMQKDDTSTNILMELRKASSHPLLFRRLYDDAVIAKMARDCMKEPEFMESNLELIKEDMAVMTDAELYRFCNQYKSVRKYAISTDEFLASGKVRALAEILEKAMKDDKRVLVFSQFTQILDILQVILNHLDYKFVRLDGSTRVDERQTLVDQFTEDQNIPVFLLSTRAGGMGINLTAASVVCIFDQDFNPHNDRQAADRAYRIGQTREVEVIKLITKGTIEEDIHRLGNTKLALDDAVGGGGSVDDVEGGSGDTKVANEVKRTLMRDLRTRLEKDV